jgi:hypothetical protein
MRWLWWLLADRFFKELWQFAYRGQPVTWTTRGLIVKPRTTWRRNGNR